MHDRKIDQTYNLCYALHIAYPKNALIEKEILLFNLTQVYLFNDNHFAVILQ